MTEVAQALRDKTAVCGAGLLLGDFPDRTALSLDVDAYQLALDDAGLKREDVDGIIQLSFGYDYDRFLEAVGTDVRYTYQGWSHGRFVAPMLQHAALAVATGMAKVVAVVHGRRRKAYGQTADHETWRQGLGPHGESPASGALGPVSSRCGSLIVARTMTGPPVLSSPRGARPGLQEDAGLHLGHAGRQSRSTGAHGDADRIRIVLELCKQILGRPDRGVRSYGETGIFAGELCQGREVRIVALALPGDVIGNDQLRDDGDVIPLPVCWLR